MVGQWFCFLNLNFESSTRNNNVQLQGCSSIAHTDMWKAREIVRRISVSVAQDCVKPAPYPAPVAAKHRSLCSTQAKP